MIIDAHYHFEPRMETEERLLAQMDKHHIDKIALIPTLCDPIHIPPAIERFADFARVLQMSRWGRGVGMFFYNTTINGKGEFSVLGKTYTIYPQPDNETTAGLIERHPNRVYGWITINPAEGDPKPLLEKYGDRPGWIGVKVHPFWHRYSVEMLDETARWCVAKNIPMLLHLGGKADSGNYRHLPEKHPKLKLIYAHAGEPFYRPLW